MLSYVYVFLSMAFSVYVLILISFRSVVLWYEADF